MDVKTTIAQGIPVTGPIGARKVFGKGQTELEITGAADTVIVVLVPESGDAVQAMKAGLMEIADVFVVNKADRPGAERLLREIRQAIHLRAGSALQDVPAHHGVDLSRVGRRRRDAEESRPGGGWTIPVLKTVAQSGEGVGDLLDAVAQHRTWLEGSGELERRRRARARVRVRDVVDRELRRVAWAAAESGTALEEGLDAIVRARIVQDLVDLVEREHLSVLLVTHDLEEAICLSDTVYLLSQGPRARIIQKYPVPMPRPRDVVHARTHPAFAPLYERIWGDLSDQVRPVYAAEAA